MRTGVIVGGVLAAALATTLVFFWGQPPGRTATTTSAYTLQTVLTTKTASAVIISNPLGSSTNTSLTFDPPYVRLRINVNNTVTWVNEDTVPHTVTSRDRFFDQVLQPGQSFTYTFDRVGVYEYVCTLHPWMSGVVEVVN
ncbi:Amicyanin [archaeon HR01]|nr:Amicyanin [archaeon HR01]